MRKGYNGEYKAKKELIEKYGKNNVIKVAIGQIGPDFLVFDKNKLIKVVEVKITKHNKYSPTKKELNQFDRIKKFAVSHNCKAEVWIYEKKSNKYVKRVEYL